MRFLFDMPVTQYESVKEFFDSLPKDAKKARGAENWNGNQTYSQARKMLWQGDSDAVERSEKLLDQMEASGIELQTEYWDNDLAGAIPCIPSYLAGSPESMRRLVESTSETSPVKIFTSVCLSGGFSASEIEKRGTAILALVRKLSLIRPVELHIYADMHGRATDDTGDCAIPVIKLDTAPLDLTTVSYALANPGFLRQLCFAWGDARGFDGAWAWRGSPATYTTRIREVLKAETQDMVINGAYLSDDLMRNPLKWVNDQVVKYTTTIES